jgi:hypothetical protein
MRLPRARLKTRQMMAVLLILAADLAWLRWFLIQGRRSIFGLQPTALDLGIVPAVSVLAFAAYLMAARGRRSGPFLTGFVTSGAVALLAYLGTCLLVPDTLDQALQSIEPALNGWAGAGPVRRMLEPVAGLIFPGNSGRFDLWQIAWVAAILSLPQGVVAMVGGGLASRLKAEPVSKGAAGL